MKLLLVMSLVLVAIVVEPVSGATTSADRGKDSYGRDRPPRVLLPPDPKKAKPPMYTTRQVPTSINPASGAVIQDYYMACMDDKSDVLDERNQELLCGCMTSVVSYKLSDEEIALTMKDTQVGRDAYQGMMISTYSQCMEFPVKNIVYDNCAQNKNLGRFLGRQKQICACVSGGMGELTFIRGAKLVTAAVQVDIDDPDPMARFFESALFNQESQRYFSKCLYSVEHGVE